MTEPTPPHPPRLPGAVLLLAFPLLSAGLLYSAYFPLAWGWTGWFALVPLLCLARVDRRPRTIFLAGCLAGLAFFGPVLQWVRVADPRMYATWAFLILFCTLHLAVALELVRRLDRLPWLPLSLSVPIVWVAVDYFRAQVFGGFATFLLGSAQHDVPGGFGWYFLGHTQHDFREMIQIADLGGVYAVTFVIAAVNGLLTEILLGPQAGPRAWILGPKAVRCGRRMGLLIQGLGVALLLLTSLAYGVMRDRQPIGNPGPRVALLQGNLDQRIRNDRSETARQSMVQHFGTLSALASRFRPDLIVWPETSYPDPWEELEPGRPGALSQALANEAASLYRTSVLLGVNSCVTGEDLHSRCYNSAVLIIPDGPTRGRWGGRYDKIHRVPFGEYIPLRSWLPFLDALAPYDGIDYIVQPGTSHTRFPLVVRGQEYHFGVVICYEDTDPSMARPYAGGDTLPAVDFLVNISNDGWFDGTSEHAEHLALCRFRAVECRRTVVRAVNMGISAVIDSNGRVLAPHDLPPPIAAAQSPPEIHYWGIESDQLEALPLSRWAEFKKREGVLLAAIPIDTRVSLYARVGDWLPGVCWLSLLILLVLIRRQGRRPQAT